MALTTVIIFDTPTTHVRSTDLPLVDQQTQSRGREAAVSHFSESGFTVVPHDTPIAFAVTTLIFLPL